VAGLVVVDVAAVGKMAGALVAEGSNFAIRFPLCNI